MHKAFKKLFFCLLLISISFAGYAGYQLFYKNRSECYTQHGLVEGILTLGSQFKYDIYRAVFGVVHNVNTMNSIVILMNEGDLDNNPLFVCRLKEEVSDARKIIQEQGAMLEGRPKE